MDFTREIFIHVNNTYSFLDLAAMICESSNKYELINSLLSLHRTPVKRFKDLLFKSDVTVED